MIMKNTMTDTRNVILSLKKVKQERGLSIDDIYELVEANDPSKTVSRTSVARVFREGSEEQIFKWENTLKPIANALLDIDKLESYDDTNTKAYKAILRLKKEIIAELEDKVKTVESDEKHKYHEKLTRELGKIQKDLDFAMEQIALKDKRIDMLMEDNHLLLTQLMSCPCRKTGEIKGSK